MKRLIFLIFLLLVGSDVQASVPVLGWPNGQQTIVCQPSDKNAACGGSSGGMAIGGAVASSTTFDALYIDGSNKLGENPNFTFDGVGNLSVNTLQVNGNTDANLGIGINMTSEVVVH